MPLPVQREALDNKTFTPYAYHDDLQAVEKSSDAAKKFSSMVRTGVNRGQFVRLDFVWSKGQTGVQGKTLFSAEGIAYAAKHSKTVWIHGREYTLVFHPVSEQTAKPKIILECEGTAPAKTRAFLIQSAVVTCALTQHTECMLYNDEFNYSVVAIQLTQKAAEAIATALELDVQPPVGDDVLTDEARDVCIACGDMCRSESGEYPNTTMRDGVSFPICSPCHSAEGEALAF